VISAEIDAERYQIQADGQRTAAITNAETQSDSEVAEQKVKAAAKVGTAYEQLAEFMALGEAYRVAPEAFKQRLWFETHEAALAEQPLVVVDEDVIVDMRPEPQLLNIIPGGVP
jgi:regulator of protease activity HflC (stomatin/prohibitin superfamily)